MIAPLKVWAISNIWGKSEQIKILFRKKLRVDDSGNACYHSVRNLLSSSFLLKIKLYITLISLLYCMGVNYIR